MAINFPGPGIVEIYYQPGDIEHKITLGLDLVGGSNPGQDADQYVLNQRGGGTTTLDVWIDNFIQVIQPFVHTGGNFSRADFWYSDQLSFDRIYQTSYDINLAGTGTGGFEQAGQVTFTYRSIEGGVGKFSVLDHAGSAPAWGRYTGANIPASAQLVNAFMTGTGTSVMARDTSYLFSTIAFLSGQNESLFKKYYR